MKTFSGLNHPAHPLGRRHRRRLVIVVALLLIVLGVPQLPADPAVAVGTWLTVLLTALLVARPAIGTTRP